MKTSLVKRWLVGAPMSLAQARHERLTKTMPPYDVVIRTAFAISISLPFRGAGGFPLTAIKCRQSAPNSVFDNSFP